MLSLIATGFSEVGNPLCIALIAGGVLLGIIFGSIPGLSATMAVALCLPMTYGMDPINGMFVAPSLARFALRFSYYEYFAVGIFSISMMASLISGSVVKGLVSGAIGLAFAMVGAAPIDGIPRLTFGFHSLDAGFDILPVLIGLFAISEIIKAAMGRGEPQGKVLQDFHIKGFGFTLQEFKSQIGNLIRSSAIGVGIGILPGIGGGTSNILAYTAAKNQSKYPEKFGTGVIDGIVASETANNASIGGALVPLLTLGIPGDTVTAMLLGGLMIHGLNPGPLLFQNNGPLVYGIFAACLIANIFMLVMEYLGIKIFARVLTVPKHILLPVIMVLCVVGAFGVNNRLFDVWAVLFFGVVAYLLEKGGFPLPPIILGFILGPMIETNLRRGLMQSDGSIVPFFTHPISLVFLLITVLVIVLAVRKELRSRKREQSVER